MTEDDSHRFEDDARPPDGAHDSEAPGDPMANPGQQRADRPDDARPRGAQPAAGAGDEALPVGAEPSGGTGPLGSPDTTEEGFLPFEGAAPFPVPPEVADYAPEELAPALAAVCFALNRPVTLGEAAAILGRSQADVALAADCLAASLRGGGLMLQRHQEELQLVTRPEVAWAVQRALNPEKPGRLSRAALETLAIVAYRQPLTRAAVEAIRGVNCEAVLDSLERRGLIAEVGRQDSPGHPRLFGTTLRFLQVVGLERIEDLPPLPAGVKVPELPGADWELDATPPAAQTSEHADPLDSVVEVRGEPVEAARPSPPNEPSGPAAAERKSDDSLDADTWTARGDDPASFLPSSAATPVEGSSNGGPEVNLLGLGGNPDEAYGEVPDEDDITDDPDAPGGERPAEPPFHGAIDEPAPAMDDDPLAGGDPEDRPSGPNGHAGDTGPPGGDADPPPAP